MNDAFSWVLSVISSAWDWLLSWSFHGVPFGFYIMGIVILSILIRFIFG